MMSMISTRQLIEPGIYDRHVYDALVWKLERAMMAYIKHGKTDPVYQVYMGNVQSLLVRHA